MNYECQIAWRIPEDLKRERAKLGSQEAYNFSGVVAVQYRTRESCFTVSGQEEIMRHFHFPYSISGLSFVIVRKSPNIHWALTDTLSSNNK
jgi:hypothetical protein